MNKTNCVQCGKEIKYKGFYCPTMCDDCNKKWIDSIKSIEYTTPILEFVSEEVKVSCLICEEIHNIRRSDLGFVFICKNCKDAILKIRENMHQEDKGE